MQVRRKCAADEEACLALLLDVHRTDGYPRYLPDDLLGFLTPPSESEAWVAEEHGAIVGHVALHDAAVDPTLQAAQRATALPAERLAVLARLLVSPAARRRGLGAELLRHATAHARVAGQRAVLDVTQDAAAPIALYEAEGWSKVDPLVLRFDDKSLLLWVYVSPDAEDTQGAFGAAGQAVPIGLWPADRTRQGAVTPADPDTEHAADGAARRGRRPETQTLGGRPLRGGECERAPPHVRLPDLITSYRGRLDT